MTRTRTPDIVIPDGQPHVIGMIDDIARAISGLPTGSRSWRRVGSGWRRGGWLIATDPDSVRMHLEDDDGTIADELRVPGREAPFASAKEVIDHVLRATGIVLEHRYMDDDNRAVDWMIALSSLPFASATEPDAVALPSPFTDGRCISITREDAAPGDEMRHMLAHAPLSLSWCAEMTSGNRRCTIANISSMCGPGQEIDAHGDPVATLRAHERVRMEIAAASGDAA